MTPRVASLVQVVEMLHAFQRVERRIRVPQVDRWENDVEHSYFLAMFTWYFIEHYAPHLDRSRAVHYALVHDLVEVYAGDTFAFTQDKDLIASKHERERLAQERLKTEFVDWPSFTDAIDAYEGKVDDEARCVYALDKMLPTFTNLIDEGRSWKTNQTTLAQVIEMKRPKVALSPPVNELFHEMIAFLHSRESELFS